MSVKNRFLNILTLTLAACVLAGPAYATSEGEEDDGDFEEEIPLTPEEMREELREDAADSIAHGFESFLVAKCVPDELLVGEVSSVTLAQADAIEKCVRGVVSKTLAGRRAAKGGYFEIASPRSIRMTAYEVIASYSSDEDDE